MGSDITGERPKRHRAKSDYRNEEPRMGEKRRPGRPRRLVVPKCSVGPCDGPVIAKGWCFKHYQRQRRHGSIWADTTKPGGIALDAPPGTKATV